MEKGWRVHAPHKTMFFKPGEYRKAFAKYEEWNKELEQHGYIPKGSEYATCVDDPKEFRDCFLCPNGKIEYLTSIYEMCGFERQGKPWNTLIED